MLITNALDLTTKQLFARYAERMTIENELDAYIQGFHLNALSSGLPLNIDLDTTLTVIAGNLYRLLAHQLPRYENATPDKLWRHFLDATGTVNTTDTTLTVDLNIRTYHPVLIAAGLADQTNPNPMAQRPRTPLPLPTPLKPQDNLPDRESRLAATTC